MHLLSFSFVFSVIFLLKFLLSEISSQSIFSKYQVPCFEEDKKLAKCDKSECDLTTDSGKIKLFRLPGYRVSVEKSYFIHSFKLPYYERSKRPVYETD